MANTKSDFATGKRNLPQPYDALIAKIPVVLTLGAAPVVNDTIELLELQPGVELIDYDILAPQLDSNGTPTLAASIGALNAGKTDLGAVYGDGLTFGRTANGSISRAQDARQTQADASVSRNIALKWTAAAATWAGNGKKITVLLHLKA